MLVSDYDYNLPRALIAQYPLPNRAAARMLVLNRRSQCCTAHSFFDFPDYLYSGDCLVVNNTQVIKARILGHKKTGGKVEALLIEKLADGSWASYLRPGNKVREEMLIEVSGSGCHYKILKRNNDGTFHIKFLTKDIAHLIDIYGHVPLPPYIRRSDQIIDEDRYQSVYAAVPGAVAAPTAGLHFNKKILDALEKKGVKIVPLTLHVGPGTFKPVSVENVEDHRLHEENYTLSSASAKVINDAKRSGGKVIAVGTTSVRVLETCADDDGYVKPGTGRTDIFLYPPYQSKTIDGLLTNFHLPKSTLIMLVCTFAAKEFIMDAYKFAIQNQFRFYSYGDCMLIV